MNQIVQFPGGHGRPPAVLQGRRSTLNVAAQANVSASFAVLSIEGRTWSVKYRGDKRVLMLNGAPVQSLDVVVVGVSPNVSKMWYATKFVQGSDSPPDCWSVDGQAPDATVPQEKRQGTVCATCPKNLWGSRITNDGKKGKECQDSRRIAVVPLGRPADLLNEVFGGPMLLRIPPMSLPGLASYAQFLEQKGAGLEFVGTRLSFDWSVTYPQLTFEALGWLDDDQAEAVVGPDGEGGLCRHPVIDRMLLQEVIEAAPAPQHSAPAVPFAQAPQQAPAAVVQAPQPPQPPQPPQQAPAAVAQAQGFASPFAQPPQQAPAAAAQAPASPFAQAPQQAPAAAARAPPPVNQATASPFAQAPQPAQPAPAAPAPARRGRPPASAAAHVQQAPAPAQSPGGMQDMIDDLLNTPVG